METVAPGVLRKAKPIEIRRLPLKALKLRNPVRHWHPALKALYFHCKNFTMKWGLMFSLAFYAKDLLEKAILDKNESRSWRNWQIVRSNSISLFLF